MNDRADPNMAQGEAASEGPYAADDASGLAKELFSGKLSVAEALARLRNRLLDLSMRNRLLNYRHPKGRSFQFVDSPNLNLLFERLEEGKAVPLMHVAEPSADSYEVGKKPEVRSHARSLGCDVSVDFAPAEPGAPYRRLAALQVLQYPTDLERMVRKISSEARTVVEETGTNMLHLMFGFLEYFDSEDSQKPVHAPLLSMPVNLSRGDLDTVSRTYLYDIAYSGEDITENVTLREKLRQQFRLEIPPLDDEESPESYFAKMQAAVAGRRGWTVKRRLTLGFLSFGKLAIWSDLDPQRSPELLSSKLLRDIFEGERTIQEKPFVAEDYDIDKHADGDLPLIYDADSSQHSALIDVKKGKSLVINGPPGTGKSQTITNIIASCLARGKKVLFVSEKLAALEVVKQRLHKAGLGDFCLELHSHKTQKRQLLDSIQQRIAGRYTQPPGYDQRVQEFRQRRGGLNSYAHLLGSRVGNSLDLTVHQVFWTAERCRQVLGEHAQGVAGLNLQQASQWQAQTLDGCRARLEDAAAALEELGCAPRESPWAGFSPRLLVKGDELLPISCLDVALGHARRMVSEVEQLSGAVGDYPWTIQELVTAQAAIDRLAGTSLPRNEELLHRMFACGLENLAQVEQQSERLNESLQRISRLHRHADVALVRRDLPDAEACAKVISPAKSVLSAEGLARTLEELNDMGSRTNDLVAEFTASLDGRQASVPVNRSALRECLDAALRTETSSQWVAVEAGELLERAHDVRSAASNVGAALAEVDTVLRANRVSFSGRTDELQALLDGRGLPELLPQSAPDGRASEELQRLSASGFRDWTAEKFSATARDVLELTSGVGDALDELKRFFSRLAIPFDGTRGDIEAAEALLAAAESAPRELLALRSVGLERSDFADVAIRAEEELKSLIHRRNKLAAVFDAQVLPKEEELRAHVKVLRRGDSIFNVLRSDWRRAKRAYQESLKDPKPAKAAAMAEQFSVVLSWRAEHRAFVDNTQYRSVIGGLFEGVKTDFKKVRLLHSWLQSSSATVLATDFGPHVNLHTIAEQHITVLAGGAGRARTWLNTLKGVTKTVAALPDIDPALLRPRRIEDVCKPMSDYAKRLETSASLVKATVTPAATVQRAVELLSLRRIIEQHGDVLRSLVASPEKLARAAEKLGLSSSTLAYQNLKEATDSLTSQALRAAELAKHIASGVGPEFSAQAALRTLDLYDKLETHCGSFLLGDASPTAADLAALLATRQKQASEVAAFASLLQPYAQPKASAQDVVDAARAGLSASAALSRLAADEHLAGLFGSHLQGVDTDVASIQECLSWAAALQAVASELPTPVVHQLLQPGAKAASHALSRGLPEVTEAFKRYSDSMSGLNEWGVLDWSRWGGGPRPSDAVARLERARAATDSLIAWSKYLAAKEDAVELGLLDLLTRVEQGQLEATSLVSAFDYVFHRSLCRSILAQHRELARFTGSAHEKLRADFADVDKQLVKLNGALYASMTSKAAKPLPGIAVGLVGDLTEMALLNKEISKQKRHIPIRQLMKRAGQSLQELKPCFMMGPLSVAQYLEQGQLEFDVVVMDEASQLRPEEALGAIARGKQLVVVGDPKQLPPTNFFDRLMDSDEEDPDAAPSVVDGVESILGICEYLYQPVRTLRWHYRSRHESLIAFSNSQFYDGRLVVFPSPYQKNRRLGVNYRYVRNGIYQDRRNLPEAQRVVDAVLEHMLTVPDESLGVVTLNQSQRELIEDLLDKKVRDVKGVAEYLERHEKAGWKFFVKNLENVQGDERDVIFVSTTFGKPPGGTSVPQYFGPINKSDGWRRLNVLFTRAKCRIDLFSSLLPEDVRVDSKASLGRGAFRAYLEYAKTGSLPSAKTQPSDREPDSDFEVAVTDALRAHKYEVVPQVGVAGYFIDIGVRHPDRRGEYLAAVECDGVNYHSSLSARDRDRIRQETLELLGWKGRIIRVWSSDWFSDPTAQTRRLVEFLEQRKRHDRDRPALFSDEDIVLEEPPSAEVELVTVVDSGDAPAPAGAVHAEPVPADPQPVERDAAEEPVEELLFVEVGDRVTYEMLVEPCERHVVHIVDSASNPRLGLLNEETPLAQALRKRPAIPS